jgi:DNA helicase II / ATP-dependent DNA helicase PcrA
MVAIEQIIKHIEENKSYVLEAGAGSGKTYTLIQTINHVLATKGESIKLNNQKIVCITYTNVAKNEIIERLENNPLVIVSTIHEFLWDCIKRFNKQLIIELDLLNEVMLIDKPDKFKTGLKDRIKTEVKYDDSGYRDFEQGSLHHDDVIILSLQMFKNYSALTHILGQKYPYLFIDEYQDTAIETVDAIVNHLLERNKTKLLVGFYGDSYQKIYDEGVGSLQTYIDSNKLELVTKDDNYRSSENVVNLLNNIRDNITQKIPESKESIEGSVQFINCTNAPMIMKPKEKVTPYRARIAPKKDSDYDNIVSSLEANGWDFSEYGDDKILIIANSKVAERAGFGNLYKIYSKRFYDPKSELLNRENHFTSYFFGSKDKKTSRERETGIEHLVSFWEDKNYNRVIKYLKQQGVFSSLTKHSDKQEIETKLKELTTLRTVGTVKDVFDFCQENKLSLPSRKLQKFLEKIAIDVSTISDEEELKRATKNKLFYEALMLTNYNEMICAFKHIQEQTSYSTKHGTKGEEYRNVLVVIDDTSWVAKYDFQKFFNNTDDKEHRKLRTKNLFYVSCSRAKENLVVLALSQMGDSAMIKITEWFGNENIQTQ